MVYAPCSLFIKQKDHMKPDSSDSSLYECVSVVVGEYHINVSKVMGLKWGFSMCVCKYVYARNGIRYKVWSFNVSFILSCVIHTLC